MTITIQNADNALFEMIKKLITKEPNNYIITQDKSDPIKEEVEKDIKLYKQGKLKTEPLGKSWKYL